MGNSKILNGFFQPKSIAIIGASRTEGSLGKVFFDSLLNYNFSGKIFPVNPKAIQIRGIPCYKSVADLPDIPDLAVILVRKELALQELLECGKAGIKNIIMISAGFKEIGKAGIEREQKLIEIVKNYDLRLLGPNCMGIINTDPKYSMNASFSPNEPYTGNVAFISQSGALGVAVLDLSKILHLGFSIFISEGNKADLTDNDFLEYLATHKQTDVIVLYLESIENPAQLRETAIKISRQKPIIAIKAGRSTSGAQAASSHTGALASSDLATDAFFKQSSILRVNSVEELFEQSLAFSKQPLPKNNKIVVITNSGGPGILAADEIESNNLEMARLTKKTKEYLKTFLLEEASVQNPIDMIASADEYIYQKTLEAVLKDHHVDAVIIIIVRPPINTTPRKIAEGFRRVLTNNTKPIFCVLMASPDEHCGLDVFQELKIPVYTYPESAARSIATMLQYKKLKSRPRGKIKKFKIATRNLKSIFKTAKIEGREYLRSEEINLILQAYQFPLASSRLVQSFSEAIRFFKKIKKPLTLKIESDKIVHKSEFGGVIINLNTKKQIKTSYDNLLKNVQKFKGKPKILGILAQETVKGDIELVFGINRDPNYGPLIMFGMGGIFVETFKDVSFRISPVTDYDALEMIKEIKGYPILRGIRGKKGMDINLIIEIIQRLSQLSLDWPQISELDLNPFIASPDRANCKIVDARIKIDLSI